MIMRSFLGFAILVFAAVQAWAFEVNEFTTPAGIEVRHVEDRTLPLIALDFVLQSGAAGDPAGKEGLATFAASLLDEGAGKYDGVAFRKLRDDNAVRLGFGVSADNVTGAMQVPTDEMELGFELLHAVMNEPTFPPDAIERIRKSLVVSAKSRENDPGSLAYRAAGEILLKGHPYNRPTSGTSTSLVTITRDDIVASHQRNFIRHGMKVAIVGDISREDATRRIDQVFGALSMGEKRNPLPAIPAWAGPKLHVVDWDMPQSLVMFGGPGIAHNDPDYIPAMVLMEIVGGERSRLNAEVREKRGLTYGIGYGLMNFNEAGFTFGSMSTPNEKAGDAIKLVRDVLQDIRENGPTAIEVEAAKSYLKGSYVFRYESLAGTSGVIAANMSSGLSANYHKGRNNLVSAVTLEKVKAVAQRLINPANLVIVVAGKPVGLTEQ
jgi:zinc protease